MGRGVQAGGRAGAGDKTHAERGRRMKAIAGDENVGAAVVGVVVQDGERRRGRKCGWV